MSGMARIIRKQKKLPKQLGQPKSKQNIDEQKKRREDSEFLKGNNLIDYSLLCSIHHFNQEDYDKVDKEQKYNHLFHHNILLIFL